MSKTTLTLPPVLQEIAEVISLDAAIRLAEAKGGQRIAIPGKLKDDHWLVDVLGKEDALQLCQYFTDGARVHVEVPFGPTSSYARRKVQVAKMTKEGKSANQIAAALGTSRRTVFAARAKNRGENPEDIPDLFNQLKQDQG